MHLRDLFARSWRFVQGPLPLHLVQLATSILPNASFAIRLRGRLISPFLGRCGKGFMIANGTVLVNPGGLSIGANSYLAHYTWINAAGGVTIGDNVFVGPMCVFASSDHALGSEGSAYTRAEKSPICIGSSVWIGSHVVLTRGVTVGERSIVAAGAVVTKDVPANCVAAGVPARVVKRLDA